VSVDSGRIRAFEQAIAQRVAERAVPFEHGTAYFVDDLPNVYDRNYLYVPDAGGTTAEELAAEANRLQATFEHRKITVDLGGEALQDTFAQLGWTVQRHLAMIQPVAFRFDGAEVAEVGIDDLAEASELRVLREPWGDPGIAARLAESRRRFARARRARYFAARVDGRVASWCDLYSDGRVAQIEDVNTLVEHRGLGLARAVVAHAAALAHAEGHELVFLRADADDWPKELYRRIGFEEVEGQRFHFLRYPSPLLRLRLRTPRLELRLGTRDELVELARVSMAGIHPPDEMPFAVAWTDDVTVERFLAHHELSLAENRPEDWSLNLIVFLDGHPIGSQSVVAERFAERRTVGTGSWLGAEFQGCGYGTEMRAAVLELAFRGLGAEAATSGSVEGNHSSARVSAKLGYETVGEGTLSPRGVPVREFRYHLERERWSSPVPVELEGVEACLSVLGAA